MIIDCHGHYTTEPAQLKRFRQAQLAALDGGGAAPELEAISDDEVRESVESNQLRILRERGGDVMIFSPKASGMEHHVTDPAAPRYLDAAALRTPSVAEGMVRVAHPIRYLGRKEFDAFTRVEAEKYRSIIEAAGMRQAD